MRQEEQSSRVYYDLESSVYDKRWVSHGGISTKNAQFEIVKDLCHGWEDKIILELGCGTGRFSSFLAKLGDTTSFLDLSFEMLRSTQGNFKEIPSTTFNGINASVYQLPFQNETFDCVLSINVFNHLSDASLALEEVVRILRPGGKCVINFANLTSYFFPAAVHINSQNAALGKNVFSKWRAKWEIDALFKNASLRVTQIRGNVYVPNSLDRPLIRDFIKFMDRFSENLKLTAITPSLFYACEKTAH